MPFQFFETEFVPKMIRTDRAVFIFANRLGSPDDPKSRREKRALKSISVGTLTLLMLVFLMTDSATGQTCATDRDGDGVSFCSDCDDGIPTCTADCTTNSDAGGGDSVADCIEVYCGTDPFDASSECTVVASESQYDAAMLAANSDSVFNYILLRDFTRTSATQSCTGADGVSIRQAVGEFITTNFSDFGAALEIQCANAVIDGVHARAAATGLRYGVRVQAPDVTIENSVFDGFDRVGIYVFGADQAWLLNNISTGTLSAPADGRGGIVIRDSDNVVVVGNVVSNNNADGIQVRNSSGLFIDHNTIADNARHGLYYYNSPSLGTCMRNNIVASNIGDALNWTVSGNTWDTAASCTMPLAPGPEYGNDTYGNATQCGGTSCSSCSCLPGGSLFSFAVDPVFASTDASAAGFYLPTEPTLIDSPLVSDLGYDRNGVTPGGFNGLAPEPGAREFVLLAPSVPAISFVGLLLLVGITLGIGGKALRRR